MITPDNELRLDQGDVTDHELGPRHRDSADTHEAGFRLLVDVEKLEREGIHARSIIGYRSGLPDGKLLRQVHKLIHEEKPAESEV